MTDDEKLAFYLRHREQIDEWAGLRAHAEAVLDARLRESAWRLEHHRPLGGVIVEKRWGYEHVFLPVEERTPNIGIGLAWKKTGLLSAGPTLALTCLDGRGYERYEAIRQATRSAGLANGLDSFGASEWLWKTQLQPAPDVSDLDEFAEYCIKRLLDAWSELRPHVLAATALEPPQV